MPDVTNAETAPDRLRVLDRQNMALQLRKQGGSYRLIAATLQARPGVPPGYNERSAHRDVRAAYERLATEFKESAEQARALDLERIDELLSKTYPRALALDYVAFDRVLALLDRRARYLGLYAPTNPNAGQAGKVQVAVGDGERTMVVQMHWPDMPPAPIPEGALPDGSRIEAWGDYALAPGERAIGEGEAQGVLPGGPGGAGR